LSDAARKVTEGKLGEKMRTVLEFVNSRLSTTASDAVEALGLKEDTARQYLRRLADEHGLIARISTGIYGPVTVSQVSCELDCINTPDEESAEPFDSDGVGEADPTSQDELVLSGP
jgi:hypothetical protein